MLLPVYHIPPEGKEKEGVGTFLFLEHLLQAGLYSEPLDLSMLSSQTKIFALLYFDLGFPCGSDGKESACNAGDPGSIPEPGRFPGEGDSNPLQYSCLENSMHRGIHGSQRV